MKTYIRAAVAFAPVLALTSALSSCSDTKSYAELLTEENHYVNNFLADHEVCLDIPADTVFITGEDAPYYRIDEDGNLYMQVLDPGTKGNRVEVDEQIFFRYTMWPLATYDRSSDDPLGEGTGNTTTLGACWFRYDNYQIQSSYDWGTGIQKPLSLLPVDCKVRLVVKSQVGFVDLMTNVQPYLFELTYQRRR
ncbi:MAG: DUF4827 domain-containing protein [Muribaculaceae bacterium]|nr:DUF4827 domain-containing protein [Muribaculaceae bacterium]